MPKNLTTNSYPTLLNQIKKVFVEGLQRIEEEKVKAYWQTGKLIAEHILANKDRADYGTGLYEDLSKDLKIDASTLPRLTLFYRTYPNLGLGPKLTWTHYRKLITVKDEGLRKRLEQDIVKKEWGAEQLQTYLNQTRTLEASADPNTPIPQLKVTRGELGTYSIVDTSKVLCPKGMVVLDLGFNIWRLVERAATKDFTLTEKPQYTYVAQVERVIDGDTLWAQIECGFDTVIREKLRLRGIDCPEIDTPEGKRAKDFTAKKIPPGSTIIVQTHKDDKYGRYLADVFYSLGSDDPGKILKEGVFLNQELLNEGLAILM